MGHPNYQERIDEWRGKRVRFWVEQISDRHRRVYAENRGRVYACSWAAEPDDPPISREAVETAWKEDRIASGFHPFNVSGGSYCDG